ncbi:MAG: fibronectin type III domain-containing protein, partial [Bacteroidales bacterium]|nr:fibronectin type III domain-containing protein [Bacteroidales bacterium]
MKKRVFSLVIALFFGINVFSQNLSSYGFQHGIDSTKWIPLTANATLVWNENNQGAKSELINMGFTFSLGEISSSYVTLKNAALYLGNHEVLDAQYSVFCHRGGFMKDSPKIVALSPSNSTPLLSTTGYLKYEVVGNAPNRVFVVETQISSYESSINQIQLHETTNDIVLVYRKNPASNGSNYYYNMGQIALSTPMGYMTLSYYANSVVYRNSASYTGTSSSVYPDNNKYLLFTRPEPSCSIPMNPKLTDYTQSSLSFTWDSEDSCSFLVAAVLDESGADSAQASAINVGSSNSYTFTNLEPNTEYDLYVCKVSGSDTSEWVHANGATLSMCAYIDSASLPYVFSNLGETFDDDSCLYVNSYFEPNSNGEYLILFTPTTLVLPPVADDVDIQRLGLRIRAKHIFSVSDYSIIVGVMTDRYDLSTLVQVDTISIQEFIMYDDYWVSLSEYTGTGKYIAITNNTDRYNSYLNASTHSTEYFTYLKEIEVDYAPLCFVETSNMKVVPNIFDDNVVFINWKSEDPNANWLLEYGVSGFIPNAGYGTVLSLSTPSCTLSNLSSYYPYDVYLSKVCSQGNVSAPKLESRFRMSCYSYNLELPCFENFELHPLTYSFISLGFENSEISCNWLSYQNSTSLIPLVTYGQAHSNEKCVSLTSSTSLPSGLVSAYIHPYQVSIANLKTSFYAKNNMVNTSTAILEVGLMSSELINGIIVLDNNSYYPIDTLYLPPGMDWVEYDVDFSSFPVDSVRNHIVYKVPPISVNGRNNRSSVLIDDISIHTIPICSRPTNFVLVGTNPNSVSLKWDIDPSANAEVIYGPKDFIPYTQYTENIIETTHNNRETIYDLDSSMVYDFYVRTVCGDEEHSMWRGPITVKPGLYYVPIGYTDYETCSSKIIFNKGDNFLEEDVLAGVRLIPTDTETQFKITLPRNEVNCIMKIFLGSDTTGRLLYSSEQSEDVSEIRYIMGDVFVSVEKIHNNSSALVYAELDIKCMDVPTCPPINNIFLANVEGRSAFVRWREMMNVALNDLTGFEYKLLDRYRNEVASGETSNDYYMFSNLQPKADYTVMVRALCNNLFYSDWDSLNFTTPCVVGRDFVIKDPDTVIYANYLPYYSNSKYNYTQQLVMASEINGSANINSISFFLNGTSTVNKTNCNIYMGHTAVTSLSNRVYVPFSDLKLVYSGEMICEQGWNTFVLDSVFNYNGIDNLVIAIDDNSGISNSSVSTKFACHLISHGSLYTYSSYNDILPSAPYTCNVMNYRNDMIFGVECDTTVECVSPSVFVVEKDTTSIHVVWAPGNLETKWLVEYKPSDENRWITVDTLRTTSKVFTDLEVNTSYDIRVVAICDDYSSSMAETVVTDKTLCTEISDVPFMEDFDSWTTEDEGFVLGCWNRLSQVNGEVNTYPKQQSLYYSYSYPKALKMVSTGTDYSLLVLPRFEYPLDTLLLSFAMYKPDNNSSHEIKVGVIEDINDLSTFEELATAYNPQGGEWKTFDFEFLNYRGRGKYIALLASDFISSPYIDNVEVSFYKECTRPYQVEVDNITQTTARVQWLDTTSSSWIVEYGLSGFERGTGSVVSTTDTFCVISNLLPNYLYDVYVYGLCMIGDTSIASFRSSFRTTCSKIVRLPYLEDFNTFRNKLPDCWHYGSRYNTDEIYVDSSYSINGGYNLRFKSQNYNTNAYIAMLPIDSMQYQMRDIMVKFKMLKPIGSASNDTKIVLGVMIDPSDISTFTAIDTFVVSATAGVWEDVEEIQLRNYMGSGKYIAFKAISRSFVMDIAIDDIEIDLIPSCFRPLQLSFTGVSDSTITFQCEERNMGTSQWVVEYGVEGYASEQKTRLIADTMPFTITGLLPDTRYAVRVASLCSEFDTSYFSDTYTLLTSSIPISLPYYYDFENEDEWYFWGGLKNSSSVKWSRGNRKSFNGEYSMYISANNGLSVSTMLQNVNASAFRDIDFGAVDTTVSVSFAALAGGNINGYEDGLAVFLVEPHYIPSVSSNLLTSPWGHVDSIDILGNVIRLDTIFDKYY